MTPTMPPSEFARPLRLTRAQVREIDRRAAEEYCLPVIVLMENAALAVVGAAIELATREEPIAILCGGGNNGGDGLAAARHLHNRGYQVTIILAADPGHLTGDAASQWRIVEAMCLPVIRAEPDNDAAALSALTGAALVIDGLLGTGLASTPREAALRLIRACNGGAPGRPVLAIDLPSGMDCDTGQVLGDCVHATRTVTFVAEKVGFDNPAARPLLGRVTVGDIGCPRELIDDVARQSVTA